MFPGSRPNSLRRTRIAGAATCVWTRAANVLISRREKESTGQTAKCAYKGPLLGWPRIFFFFFGTFFFFSLARLFFFLPSLFHLEPLIAFHLNPAILKTSTAQTFLSLRPSARERS